MDSLGWRIAIFHYQIWTDLCCTYCLICSVNHTFFGSSKASLPAPAGGPLGAWAVVVVGGALITDPGAAEEAEAGGALEGGGIPPGGAIPGGGMYGGG